MNNIKHKLFTTLVLVLAIRNCFADNYISIKRTDGHAYGEIGIILLGDSGEKGARQTQVATAIQKYCNHELCSFGLLLGDNIYEDGVASVHDPLFITNFEDPYKHLQFKFYPVIGNHDAVSNWQAEIDYSSSHWQMGGRYYLIDAQWLNLFALDTNLMVNLHENMTAAAALQQQWLASALSTSKATWNIVYAHHPIFSNGLHGDNEALQRSLQPLLEQYAVDFYIAGHDHDKELIKKNGVTYIISGTGSRPRPITAGKDSTFAASGTGFAHLLLTHDTAVLKFVNGDGKIEYTEQFHQMFLRNKTLK